MRARNSLINHLWILTYQTSNSHNTLSQTSTSWLRKRVAYLLSNTYPLLLIRPHKSATMDSNLSNSSQKSSSLTTMEAFKALIAHRQAMKTPSLTTTWGRFLASQQTSLSRTISIWHLRKSMWWASSSKTMGCWSYCQLIRTNKFSWARILPSHSPSKIR